MKYIVADSGAGHIEIATITEDPKAYISGFEPIDAVDGEMFAWDEEGNLYHFASNNPPSKPIAGKLFQSVDVGNWDFKKDEPLLVKVMHDQQRELKEALVQYLLKATHIELSDASRLSVAELIEKASETLNT